MDRDLDLPLKILKLMKYGNRAITDQLIKVALIVFGVVIINKLLIIFERWLSNRGPTCECTKIVSMRTEECSQLADQQLLAELETAAAGPRN